MNKVILVGRITNDLELQTTKSSINYVRFTLAVARRNSNTDATDFIPVTAWRNSAVFLTNNAMKGSRILVEGSFTTSRYANAQGQTVTSNEVTAESIELLETKQQFESRKSGSYTSSSSSSYNNNSNPSNVTFEPTNHSQPSPIQNDEKDEEEWDLENFI